MNIKQMAALNVAKVLGGGILIAVIVNLGIHYLGITTVGIIACSAMFIYCVKMVYDIELSKLESRNALKKLKELE